MRNPIGQFPPSGGTARSAAQRETRNWPISVSVNSKGTARSAAQCETQSVSSLHPAAQPEMNVSGIKDGGNDRQHRSPRSGKSKHLRTKDLSHRPSVMSERYLVSRGVGSTLEAGADPGENRGPLIEARGKFRRKHPRGWRRSRRPPA
jgi:hypothetical protein